MISRSTDVAAALRHRSAARSLQRGLVDPYRFGAPVIPSTLLMHCDGANAGTTFTDSSAVGRTLTRVTSTTSTTQFKFGTTALKQSGGYVQTGLDADLVIGTQDFSIDCWVFQPGGLFNIILVACDDGTATAGRWALKLENFSGFMQVQWNTNGAQVNRGATTVTDSAWRHVALGRVSNQLTFWSHGQRQIAPFANSTNYNANLGIRVGGSTGTTVQTGNAAASSANLYIDEVRVIVGTCAYDLSGNITVPSAPYTA